MFAAIRIVRAELHQIGDFAMLSAPAAYITSRFAT
jgi:hypothetical protein